MQINLRGIWTLANENTALVNIETGAHFEKTSDAECMFTVAIGDGQVFKGRISTPLRDIYEALYQRKLVLEF